MIEVSAEAEEADEPKATPEQPEEPSPTASEYAADGWNAAQCQGKRLDLEAMRKSGSCLAKDNPRFLAPAGLQLKPPPSRSIPQGNPTQLGAKLVNTTKRSIAFVVVVGDGFPTMSVSKLRHGGTNVEAACQFGMLTSGKRYYIVLEPEGELAVSGTLYPNEALQDASEGAGCVPTSLPRGNTYQVQLGAHVNQSEVVADWTFEIH